MPELICSRHPELKESIERNYKLIERNQGSTGRNTRLLILLIGLTGVDIGLVKLLPVACSEIQTQTEITQNDTVEPVLQGTKKEAIHETQGNKKAGAKEDSNETDAGKENSHKTQGDKKAGAKEGGHKTQSDKETDTAKSNGKANGLSKGDGNSARIDGGG